MCCQFEEFDSLPIVASAMKVFFLPSNNKFRIDVILIPDGSAGQEKNHATSQMPALMSEYLTPYSQLELNQSIVRTLFSMESISCLFMFPFSLNMSGTVTVSLVSCPYLFLVQGSAAYQYPDPYYAGMIPPYGTQAVVIFCCLFKH